MYKDFAQIYDSLMYDVDYSRWANYIESIFKENGIQPSLVLDLGCGTGSMCIELAKRGYDMIGVDRSPEMLSRAREKTLQQGMEVLFLNQDMTDFELYGTVDAVLCLMDSVNYVLSKRDLKRLFKLVKNYLNPGGIVIFDVNSQYKLENILGNELFFDVGDDVTYIWQNSFDKSKKICRFDLTFFVKEEDLYRRYDEVHFERAYSRKELLDICDSAGLNFISEYDDLSLMKAGRSSERIFFVFSKSID